MFYVNINNQSMKSEKILMRTVPYDLVASEYYDATHLASRNVDQTSLQALLPVRTRVPSSGLVLEAGSGRGRSKEFLKIDSRRVVQLDSSKEMLDVSPREKCLLRVEHQAECLPFFDREFSCVVSFLCDPFLGLNFLSEVYRVLQPGGLFVATAPSYEWGVALREILGMGAGETRFMARQENVTLPSVLIPRSKLHDMLEHAGFAREQVCITAHRLPDDVESISPDIVNPAQKLGLSACELDILYVVEAKKSLP